MRNTSSNASRQKRSQNSTSNTDSINEANEEQSYSGPDYIAMQYREVKVADGWKTRKERVGAAFNNANGSICFRPTGRQVIENDIYLFPNDNVPN